MEEKCRDCPRECGADRANGEVGFCSCGYTARVSRVSLHKWEEPPVSGSRGSGTIFFSGCSLRCVFCQNRTISRCESGRAFSSEELADAMLVLENAGAHNINLVTPTHYLRAVVDALKIAKPHLSIPVVYNCGGYEKVASLRRLEGLVDIYLPDFKYYSPELSAKYSSASDYFSVASAALAEMYRQVGDCVFENELIKKGVIVRHLVLPGCRHDSITLLQKLAEILPVDGVRLSIMRQFTPEFVSKEEFPELCRRLTGFEYESVLREADRLGFIGYSQAAGSADKGYTPEFNTDEAFAILDCGGEKVT